ncbi:UNVERIFIED_CONTAM: hypothetical protein Sradi_3016500 [Sesamum radiatum]|uniref:Uncharacterized protein n=1 Tax=Sesamum radiatum TaxID=300843 RepID=A0AAW2S1D3_SESRA
MSLATSKLVACGGQTSAIPACKAPARGWGMLLGALASSPLPAKMEASRAAGDGLHPRPSAPGGTHTAWACTSPSVARDPKTVACGWRTSAKPGMQGSRSGLGYAWVRLLVARCLRKWRRGAADTACTTKSVRSLRLCSLGAQISFVPNLRAYRGMLGRACCRPPTAMLKCVVGRRALACASGHCVRNGRVSGDWRVWACWIPARAATTSPASRLSRRPKRAVALAAVGFLCCIPIAKAFYRPERPVSALCRAPRGCGAGRTSKHTLCPTSRARPHVLGLLAHGVVARSLGCGNTVGMRPSASVVPKNKRSTHRANDARHRLGLVPCGRGRRTTAKAFAKDVFINQERKLGARRRSDTVLVSTINDADQGSADVAFRTPPAPYEKSKSLGSGGSMVARLKLKGIDGRAPPGVEPAA